MTATINARTARELCLLRPSRDASKEVARGGLDAHALLTLLRDVGSEPGPPDSVVSSTWTVTLADGGGRITDMTVYMPATADARRPAVILGLHGAGADGATLHGWLRPLADTTGAALLCPTALEPSIRNGNFDLAGVAGGAFAGPRWTTEEQDIPLRALDWARRFLDVDVERCALVGASMGAVTAWALAARRWALLSAIVPIAGAPSVWERFGPDRAERALAENLLEVPLCAVHGDADRQIPIELDRAAVGHLERLGHRDVALVEVPGGEHAFETLRFTPESRAFCRAAQLIRSVRRVRSPRRIVHRAHDPQHGRAHWVEITGIAPGVTGRVAARVIDRRAIAVDTSGVGSLRLHLTTDLVDPGPVAIIFNGHEREIQFTPSLDTVTSTFLHTGAHPGLTAQMIATFDEIAETT